MHVDKIKERKVVARAQRCGMDGMKCPFSPGHAAGAALECLWLLL